MLATLMALAVARARFLVAPFKNALWDPLSRKWGVLRVLEAEIAVSAGDADLDHSAAGCATSVILRMRWSCRRRAWRNRDEGAMRTAHWSSVRPQGRTTRRRQSHGRALAIDAALKAP